MRRTAVIAAALAWLAVGCAGVSTEINWDESYGFSALGTYAWIEHAPPPGIDPETIAEIVTTADTVLQRKGYRRDTNGPSFLVSYQFGPQAEVAPRHYANPYWRDTYAHVNTHSRLIIDVIDPKTNEAAWSGSADIEAKPTDSHKNGPLIRRAVRELLADFPPENGSA